MSKFLPVDRRLAYLQERPLPQRDSGAILLADLSGSVSLLDNLTRQLGRRRGAEEMSRQLNLVHAALIDQIHQYRGSVVGFHGDGLSCWFARDDGRRAISCAHMMQLQMTQFNDFAETTAALGIKTAVAVGPAHRFVLGDPARQQYDFLGGATMVRAAQAEGLAKMGELVVDGTAVANLGEDLIINDWRPTPDNEQTFAVVAGLRQPAPPDGWSFSELYDPVPDGALSGQWLPPTVAAQLANSSADFFTEIRPAVALFLNLANPDYEDETAVAQFHAYVRWTQQIAHDYGGIIVDVSASEGGVYLYLAFGAPIAHDDDAARAVAAAQRAQRLPPQFEAIGPTRIGLAAGQMRAGAYGSSTRLTYGVLGEAANLAARLVSLTPPGQIYADYETFRAARRHWQFQPRPPVRVKGKVALTRIYELTGDNRATPLMNDAPLAELVGRQAEAGQIAAALERLTAGQGGVLCVMGEAGMGKSRLMAEAARLIRERGFIALVGYGSSVESQTPYRAWQEIMRSYFDLDNMNDPAAQAAQVREVAQLAAPDQMERLPLLNDLLSIALPETAVTAELDPALRQQNILLLIQALLAGWAQRQPLIIALEDGHWLDSLSWELTLQIARRMAAERPLLLLIAQRPLPDNAPAARASQQLRQLPQTETIRLAPLPPEAIARLLRHRLRLTADGLPAPLTRLIVDRAEGNPFYAEELAQNLQEQGIISLNEAADQPGHFRAELLDPHSGSGRTLPDTVQGVVLARIDRLPTERQLVLKVAAVIGRVFPIRLLRQALNQYQYRGMTAAELDENLAALTRQRLIQPDPADPERNYIFRHSLTHSVTYETLLQAQRETLHRFVAEWYEAVYGDGLSWLADQRSLDQVPAGLLPHLSLLARHYQQAGNAQRERLYARLAGLQAARQYAQAEAIAHFSQALALTGADGLAGQFELLLARQTAYGFGGQRTEQAADLERLLQIGAELNDPRRQATALLHWARRDEQLGNYDTAVARAEQAIGLAAQAGGADAPLLAQGYFEWGMALMRQSRYEDARIQFYNALRQARQAQVRQIEAGTLRVIGVSHAYQGDYRRAHTLYEEARTIFHSLGDLAGEARCYANTATSLQYLGDYAQSLALNEKALAISRQIGDRYWESGVLGNIGQLYIDVGMYDLAEQYARQALAIDIEVGSRASEGLIRASLGWIYVRLGRCAEARDYAREAVAIGWEIGASQDSANALQAYGDALLCLGELAEARLVYEQAAEIRVEVGQMGAAVESWAALAQAYSRLGETAAAQAWSEKALPYLLNKDIAGAEQIFQVYQRVYETLAANGDERATAVQAICERLKQERAAGISDETMRESFWRSAA